MTAVRLTRTLQREVARPILRTKRNLFRAICSGGSPRPSGQAGPDRDEPIVASNAASAPVPAATAPGASKPERGSKRTKADLYEEAVRRDIPGRSTMTKAQLAKALGLA